MNPLAQFLRMSPEIAAYGMPDPAQDPRAAALYYPAMQAMRGMPAHHQPATDMENLLNMQRFAQAAGGGVGAPAGLDEMWMRREPGTERQWEYGVEGASPLGDIGYETDETELRKAGWGPINEYLDEIESLAQENEGKLPDPVRLRLERILRGR